MVWPWRIIPTVHCAGPTGAAARGLPPGFADQTGHSKATDDDDDDDDDTVLGVPQRNSTMTRSERSMNLYFLFYLFGGTASGLLFRQTRMLVARHPHRLDSRLLRDETYAAGGAAAGAFAWLIRGYAFHQT